MDVFLRQKVASGRDNRRQVRALYRNVAIKALQDGIGPGGAVALNATTVFGDDQRDQLWGGSGSDWFLLDRRHPTPAARDLALDLAAFEAVLAIRPRE